MMNWKIVIALFVGLLTMTMVSLWAYLVGAFCAANFDMTQWDPFGRFMLGVLGGGAAAVSGCVMFVAVAESRP
jgi:hypothetical protein